MALATYASLQRFLERYAHDPAVKHLRAGLEKISADGGIDALIGIYNESIPLLEQAIWSGDPEGAPLELYQRVFRELEAHIASKGHDDRHHFILVIPVADRPQHLRCCLDSLLELCRRFNYGGSENNKYKKVSVVIADDSKDEVNIGKHQEIARQFNEQGLETIYFGPEEQLAQIDALAETDRQALTGVLGEADRSAFYHKGPSRTRNIAYLKLGEMQESREKVLFYFLDSDQEFRVKSSTPRGDRDLYAVNYLYYLDAVFSGTDACMLTGKVVGDPPVSPAVMAGNFLDDVIRFLQQLADLEYTAPCRFHGVAHQPADDAAYHDMAELFGFKQAAHSFQYQCTLGGPHDNARCFNHFAGQLNRFFYGEHPTRKTYYEYAEVRSNLAPARTVYTGNYVFKPEGLKYFIPFAKLKLRMAGPVLGRVIKAEIKERFVSANLPMLHKRTVEDSGRSEFRPGINRDRQRIDLSGEFERQYFGDVMLFSIEKLTAQGYPGHTPAKNVVTETVKTTEETIYRRYMAKHTEILNKLERLRTILHDAGNWWNTAPGFDDAKGQLTLFLDNIEHNYGDGSYCYRMMNASADKQRRISQIAAAVMQYSADRQAWERVLSKGQHSAQPGNQIDSPG